MFKLISCGSHHVGIPGNDKADAMADEAITSGPTPVITKTSTKDLINKAQKRILLPWQNHWGDIPTSNKLRNVNKKNSLKMVIP